MSTPSTSSPTRPTTPTPSVQPAVEPRTPSGGNLKTCTTDKSAYKLVKVHTAKCTECDRRNMDTMLRCPGCAFQICKPCRERRDEQGRELAHGVMASPGGLGLRSGGLGSGGKEVTRKKLGVVSGGAAGSSGTMGTRSTPGSMKGKGRDDGAEEVTDRGDVGKGKKTEKVLATPATKVGSKKRPAKTKPKVTLEDDSSDEEFTLDVTSPTSNKRRRPITDRPTATSIRPSRKVSVPNAYVAPASSSSPDDGSSPEVVHGRPTTSILRPQEVNPPQPRPKDRIQELLEELGVNTPENPYQEHFLGRRFPVMSNPVINMPRGLAGGSGQRPGTQQQSPEQDMVPREDCAMNTPQYLTIRLFSEMEAGKYQNDRYSKDENEELLSSILAASRKWANSVYDQALEADKKQVVQRGLDMRLDLLDLPFTAELAKLIEQTADAKLREFEEDHRSSMLFTPGPALSKAPK